MSYEKTFRRREEYFNPRKDFSHVEVVNEFAGLFRVADDEVSYLHNRLKLLDESIEEQQKDLNKAVIGILLVGFILGSIVSQVIGSLL